MRLLLILSLLLSFAMHAASDQAIEEEIRTRFARSKIHTNGFQVRVQKGVATLTGKTDVIQHKGTATRIAKNSGATSVINNIQIGERAREKASQRLSAVRKTAASPAPKSSEKTAAVTPAPGPGDVPPPVRHATVKH